MGYMRKKLYIYHENVPNLSTYKTNIEGKIGRNDKCVCGSGRKYKKCCLKKYEEAARILRDVYNQKNIDYKIGELKK